MLFAFKLADIKVESSEAYLLKLGKNRSWDFEAVFIFCKSDVPISKVFIPIRK